MAETADILRARRAALQEPVSEPPASAPKSPPWTHRKPSVNGSFAHNADITTPGGVGSAAGLVLVAATIAFLGSMREAGGFPSNGVRIIFSAMLLAIILSVMERGPIAGVVRGLGYLMVLAALVRYVPKFNTGKVKKNG